MPAPTIRLILSTLVILFVASRATSADFVVVDLGTLDQGKHSEGYSIDSQGWITGVSSVANTGGGHAFRWTPGGGMSDIGNLPGYRSISGAGINAPGMIAGTLVDSEGVSHAFNTKANGEIQELTSLPGGTSSFGMAISDSNDVTGGSTTLHGQVHAFRTMGGKSMIDLGTLKGGTYSEGASINEYGQVTGTANTSYGAFHAFRTGSGGMQDLGTIGGTSSFGAAINSAGVVAGYGMSGNGETHAFRSTARGQLEDLGTLMDGTSSMGLGINHDGSIVGRANRLSLGDRAFLWKEGTGMVDLNGLINPSSGWALMSAQSINDRGQIAGIGTIGGQTHGFLLTDSSYLAVPAPPSAWLLGLGVVGLLSCRRLASRGRARA